MAPSGCTFAGIQSTPAAAAAASASLTLQRHGITSLSIWHPRENGTLEVILVGARPPRAIEHNLIRLGVARVVAEVGVDRVDPPERDASLCGKVAGVGGRVHNGLVELGGHVFGHQEAGGEADAVQRLRGYREAGRELRGGLLDAVDQLLVADAILRMVVRSSVQLHQHGPHTKK